MKYIMTVQAAHLYIVCAYWICVTHWYVRFVSQIPHFIHYFLLL